jgi:hypothetical protein
MTSIAALRVHAVDVTHQARQIGSTCFDYEMIVVAHQAVGKAHGIESHERFAADVQQAGTVVVVVDDLLPSITARGDMIERAGEFKT